MLHYQPTTDDLFIKTLMHNLKKSLSEFLERSEWVKVASQVNYGLVKICLNFSGNSGFP
jgi:hypothetical protein